MSTGCEVEKTGAQNCCKGEGWASLRWMTGATMTPASTRLMASAAQVTTFHVLLVSLRAIGGVGASTGNSTGAW